MTKKNKIPKSNNERKQYCSNNEMIAELRKFKETGVMSNELGKMFIDIANKLGGHTNFRYYNNNIKDELISSAIHRLVANAHKFDVDRENANAFSYFTQVAWNAFVMACKQHYKHVNIKQKIATEYLNELESIDGLCDCNYLKKQLTEMISTDS
jgi:hypothetical protein